MSPAVSAIGFDPARHSKRQAAHIRPAIVGTGDAVAKIADSKIATAKRAA